MQLALPARDTLIDVIKIDDLINGSIMIFLRHKSSTEMGNLSACADRLKAAFVYETSGRIEPLRSEPFF